MVLQEGSEGRSTVGGAAVVNCTTAGRVVEVNCGATGRQRGQVCYRRSSDGRIGVSCRRKQQKSI